MTPPITMDDHQAIVSAQVDAGEHTTPDRFPAPTAGGSQGSTLVLAVGPFRDWLDEYMRAHDLTSADVARCIGRDESMVRGWFGVRGRDWRTQSPQRFVVHIISELVIEHVGMSRPGSTETFLFGIPALDEMGR